MIGDTAGAATGDAAAAEFVGVAGDTCANEMVGASRSPHAQRRFFTL